MRKNHGENNTSQKMLLKDNDASSFFEGGSLEEPTTQTNRTARVHRMLMSGFANYRKGTSKALTFSFRPLAKHFVEV